jgi:hypothetical protein
MNKNLFWIAGVVFLGLVLFFNITGFSVVSGQDFKVNASLVGTEAEFFESDGIRFFAVRASDGSIRTAFDACDVCYASRKGYRQEGDFMVCNNCGNRYLIDGLGTENTFGGGCWPGYLPSNIAGNSLIIKKSDLENGRYRFE